jgi:hypothetical protein
VWDSVALLPESECKGTDFYETGKRSPRFFSRKPHFSCNFYFIGQWFSFYATFWCKIWDIRARNETVSKCPFFVSHTCADEEKTDKNIQKQVKTFILLPYPNLTKREEHHPEHRNFNHTTIFFRHELPPIIHEPLARRSQSSKIINDNSWSINDNSCQTTAPKVHL